MPTNLYGPGDNYHPENSHVMASLIRKFCEASKNSIPSVKCWGTGNPLREFLHVNDLGDAVIFALEKWDPDSQDAPKDNNILFLINSRLEKSDIFTFFQGHLSQELIIHLLK